MRTLYHYPLCPFSRKIRLILAEKKLDFELKIEKPWERRTAYLNMNPAAQVPTLVELNSSILCDSWAIQEYLEETYPETFLIGKDPTEKAEVRRLVAWFDHQFGKEVWQTLVFEKAIKRTVPASTKDRRFSQGPDSAAIRYGRQRLHHHLSYISWLADQRKWLAGDQVSVADFSAAAQLSVVDYLGDIPWQDYPPVKDWYAKIKSRPSFRALLDDRIPGINPAPHYTDLDF